ncbi:transposase-like protein [Chitinophaga terrae (ex Kim and Jung 2007)]|uniref:hypothetical protein n=1 Tax=Chitinophaga terrae (ex Kim and Jung 2007) TaxID=408074 RepID=UPI00278401A2|nr:hypothetical protein [Chitinophaga terrae (ex Kim and Jung 2007)]MDQ0108953.1 transposase-like protein [Chitinophaga terrae (ex Kim and Jung 2007)]
MHPSLCYRGWTSHRLLCKDGVSAYLLKDILKAALEEEMKAPLDDKERANRKRKNGKNHKRLKTTDGTIGIPLQFL